MAHHLLRRFRFVVVLVAFLGGGLAPAVAQDGTPAAGGGNPFAALGLPEIAVTITEDAFKGVPTELAAGRYVLSVTNLLGESEMAADPGGAGVGFLQLPPEMTGEAFVAQMSPSEGTPEVSGDVASPAAEEGSMTPPPWYYEVMLAGGPYAVPGERDWAVIDLAAGDWVLWGETPGAPQRPVPVTVTGAAPADVPTVRSDIRVEMSEYAFSFTPTLTAGTHVIEVANVGEQPHFVFLGGVPDGTTVDDALALFASVGDPAATPDGGLAMEEITEVLDTADQSAGVTAWYTADLGPGTYLAVCFVPDPASGTPHAMLGMTQIVEVE